MCCVCVVCVCGCVVCGGYCAHDMHMTSDGLHRHEERGLCERRAAFDCENTIIIG